MYLYFNPVKTGVTFILFESSQISDTTQLLKVYKHFGGRDEFHMVHSPQRPARNLITLLTELPQFLGGGYYSGADYLLSHIDENPSLQMATKWSNVSSKFSVTYLNDSPAIYDVGVRTFL